MKWLMFLKLVFCFFEVFALEEVGHSLGPLPSLQGFVDQIQRIDFKGDRPLAMKRVSERLARNHEEERPVLLLELNRMSNTFHSIKAQQLHEAALSLAAVDAQLAEQKLEEALELEPSSYLLLVTGARLALRAKRCSVAFQRIHAAQALNPFLEWTSLMEIQHSLCSKNLKEMTKSLEEEFLSQPDNAIRLVLRARLLLALNRLPEAYVVYLKARGVDSSYPEVVRLAYDLSLHGPADAPAALEPRNLGVTYVQLCRNLTARSARAYAADPFLCLDVEELSAALERLEVE